MDYQTQNTIPMSSPDLTDLERQAVLNVLNSTSLSIGPQLQIFEEAISRYTGSRYAIGVNSGTSGLHLCVRAAGITPGDLVITTPFSFVSSANAILFEGGVPVFVDVDPLSGNIDPALVDQAASDLQQGGSSAARWLPRNHGGRSGPLKAILGVDVFGQPADWDSLRKSADRWGLGLIEDACEALGAEYRGRKAGTLGDSAVFAFYPNKQITTGEGGMIVTGDEEAARLMRSLRNQGRSDGDTWLQHTHLGYNYRLDELSAALGAAQMLRLEELLQKRSRVAAWYANRLADIPLVQPPFRLAETTRQSWFVYVIRLRADLPRDKVVDRLAARGIPARPYFNPIHLQPYMVERFGYQLGDFPVTEDLGKRGLALPFSSKMSEEQVNIVCDVLQEIIT